MSATMLVSPRYSAGNGSTGCSLDEARQSSLKDELIKACQNGELRAVTAILQSDPRILSDTSDLDYSPLHWATLHGHVDICKALLSYGHCVNGAYGETKVSPLHWAAYKGHCRIGCTLIKHGGDPKLIDGNGYSPLHTAACNGHSFFILMLLENWPELLDSPDAFGRTALQWATIKGHELTCRMLVNLGANVNAHDFSGVSILQWSLITDASSPWITRMLLTRGANSAHCDHLGRNASSWASIKQRKWFSTLMDQHKPSLTTRFKQSLATTYGPHILVLAAIWLISATHPIIACLLITALVTVGNWLITRVLIRGIRTIETRLLIHLQWGLIIWPSLLYLLFLRGGLAFYVYPISVGCMILCLVKTMKTDPGKIKSTTKICDTRTITNISDSMEPNDELYCTTCMIQKPLRSKHCRICDACISRFDHHCPWTGCCIGSGNHSYFALYLLFLTIGVICFYSLCFKQTEKRIIRAFMLVCLLPMAFVVTMDSFQIFQIVTNTTNNELRKRFRGGRLLENPYHVSYFLNIAYFFNWSMYKGPKWHQLHRVEPTCDV